jgi:exodeoxyribonuclease VII small subunit
VKSAPEKELSFEGALERLEQLVARMETGELPLAEMIDRFEEGNKLLGVCTKRLHDAGRKIEVLRQDRESKAVTLENFDPDQS